MDFQEEIPFLMRILSWRDVILDLSIKKRKQHTEANAPNNIIFIPGLPMTKPSSFYYISL